MTARHPKIQAVTERIIKRSRASREAYLAGVEQALGTGTYRHTLPCSNLAHCMASGGGQEKTRMQDGNIPNFGIVSAYNDILSAHQPYRDYPELIKQTFAELGVTAQFAGGVPAMCDGVTQGQTGMELSLFSRDVIALSTAVALTHNIFEGALMLGICDKIVPGLLIGALAFGHLPVIFVPAGPMPSGLSNAEKSRMRKRYAEGKIDKASLLKAESGAYHSPGTCTFYGTANTNQMLMEIMGLHLPGATFINPGDSLRPAFTRRAVRRMLEIADRNGDFTPVSKVVDERSIVNGIAGLMATGGSTNHTLHIIAIANAAGIQVNWTDFADISSVVPLLARMYPNGSADVNHFEQAGGMAFIIDQLLESGLIHGDVITVNGNGLDPYRHPLDRTSDEPGYLPTARPSSNLDILRPAHDPFAPTGGINLLEGNLGRAIIKTSALKPHQLQVTAPATIFHGLDDLFEAFKADTLNRDTVVVLRYQGPRAKGMPELHKLSPIFEVLQDRGHRVALITDGRMSGASGKMPSAIHLVPEAAAGGPIAKLRDGDRIHLDVTQGKLEVEIDPDALMQRECEGTVEPARPGFGTELFAGLRAIVGDAEAGASVIPAIGGPS